MSCAGALDFHFWSMKFEIQNFCFNAVLIENNGLLSSNNISSIICKSYV